jgi:general secretion pathway protein I
MRRQLGFTLLEVMVAVAVMSIGIVGALQLFSGSLRLVNEADRQTRALVLGRSLVDEALWRSILEEGTQSGEEGEYRWSLTTRPIQRELVGMTENIDDLTEQAGELGLWEIVAEVTWLGPAGEKTIVLETARIGEEQL